MTSFITFSADLVQAAVAERHDVYEVSIKRHLLVLLRLIAAPVLLPVSLSARLSTNWYLASWPVRHECRYTYKRAMATERWESLAGRPWSNLIRMPVLPMMVPQASPLIGRSPATNGPRPVLPRSNPRQVAPPPSPPPWPRSARPMSRSSSTGNSFSYDIQATISGAATGVDTVAITVPGALTVRRPLLTFWMTAFRFLIPTTTSGNAISVDITTKITASSKITVLFDADAPGTQDLTGKSNLSRISEC